MLDSSFGKAGKVLTEQINVNHYQVASISNLVLLDDGKIIAAGTAGDNFNGYYDDGVIARYLPDGSIDKMYGNNGIVYTDYKGASNNISDIKKQTSGKIIALGTAYPSDSHTVYYLDRYNTNGSADSLFAGNSRLILPSSAYSITIQPDDEIIVCGEMINGNKQTYAIKVRRYNKNGKIDSTFGINGLATVQLGSKQVFNSYPIVALDNLQRIVIGCYNTFNNIKSNGITVLRLTNQGHIDSTFNKTGIAVGSALYTPSYFSALCIQPDNKILVGSFTSATNDFMINRFNENGTTDKGFGSNGIAKTDFTAPGRNASDDYIKAFGIQADGKIIAAGYGVKSGTSDTYFTIARYLPNGNADSSFGFGNGKTITQVEPYEARANAVIVQPNGSILSGGYSIKNDGINGSYSYFTLVRYLKEKRIAKLAADKVSQTKNKIDIVQTSIILYPNPAKDVLFLKGLPATPVPYQLINDNGIILQSSVVSNARINVSALKAGIYYLKIRENKKTVVLKFEKH